MLAFTLYYVFKLLCKAALIEISLKSEQIFLLEDIWDESRYAFGDDADRIHLDSLPDISVQVFENSIGFNIRNLISDTLNKALRFTHVFQFKIKTLTIAISDYGCGIKGKLKSRVLNPYERGDMYEIEGLGIGLTIVKAMQANKAALLS